VHGYLWQRNDDTSMARGGDDEDDPDMSLQSTTALATSPLHDGFDDGSSLPRLPPLDAVVILITLNDLALFVLCLARGTPPLCGRFILVGDRLLRERRLGRIELRTPQLQRQEDRRSQSELKVSEKVNITTKSTEQPRCIEKTMTHEFLSPLVGEHRQ
jgi:hypothetical protein